MSSLSGAQFEAEFPAGVPEPQERRELEVFRRAQKGDRAAYGQIVISYQDRLYNAVLRLVGDRDEARELTQEAFTRGLSKLDTFRGEASPYTWLFRIAMNLAISRVRKVQRHRVFSLSADPRGGRQRSDDGDQAAGLMQRLASTSATPPQVIEQRERSQQVLAALGRLDSEYRAILVMRDVEGFDYQQMADMLAIPLGTLKSRLFRARLELRKQLQGYLRMDWAHASNVPVEPMYWI